jgi:hypothetical protein
VTPNEQIRVRVPAGPRQRCRWKTFPGQRRTWGHDSGCVGAKVTRSVHEVRGWRLGLTSSMLPRHVPLLASASARLALPMIAAALGPESNRNLVPFYTSDVLFGTEKGPVGPRPTLVAGGRQQQVVVTPLTAPTPPPGPRRPNLHRYRGRRPTSIAFVRARRGLCCFRRDMRRSASLGHRQGERRRRCQRRCRDGGGR